MSGLRAAARAVAETEVQRDRLIIRQVATGMPVYRAAEAAGVFETHVIRLMEAAGYERTGKTRNQRWQKIEVDGSTTTP